ncbi:N-acetylglutaminylglutamine synthetase [Arenibaculum sp.]|jgi:GNAT-family acetyltransferase (TIGR03103 family)|uniref:N-acetylglutaminylglutamine synthetase n=1 Tax=Arenibaculum sp. TaxID=2865862 RepID=UPI002E1662D9|nr:N-acetylglutaminylglutamine synthetase [Arenibaculum sp.]
MALARIDHRLARRSALTLRNWVEGRAAAPGTDLPENVTVDCGWGRLLFAHTFRDHAALAQSLRAERPGQRDIALYLRDPHVVLALAPQELFLDPSHTYRLWLATYRPARRRAKGFVLRRLRTLADARAVNRIYAARRMVPVDPAFLRENRNSRVLTHYVAEEETTGEVIGSVTGVDHVHAFGDPENGSSLWCLAVDPQAAAPGVGESLVRMLAEHFQARGRAFMDLSVLHDNVNAIALYEKLGFQRVPVFALKARNAINERLFTGPPPEDALNPYAMIIINEARRRGIAVDVLDAEAAFFRLSFGGRSIACRESLSELTTSVAMSRCDDKAVTRRCLEKEGLRVPAQRVAAGAGENAAFLAEHGSVVVKPARGEQGRGITVDVRTPEEVEHAVEAARAHAETVLLEQYVEGQDLRIVVIDYKVVAAAIRRPAEVTGTGEHTIAQLIEAQSRRRAAATGGESRIPMDRETERCVASHGWSMDDVLPAGERLAVRKTANLHTGGTLHDVTDHLHPALVTAARAAARALEIPVVGLDFLVPSPSGPDYVIIEANERPGLANHEPQPTAERFIDLLFPHSAIAS